MSGPETILVVDDEEDLRLNMRTFLEDMGFQVLTASRGLEAMEACRAQPPDLILLDVTMPGMDGYEVCRRLKDDPATAEIPVLFLSGSAGTADKVRAFASGGVDYVSKPFQFEEIQARVRAHLELHSQRVQLQAQNEALRRLEDLKDNLTQMLAHDMRGPLTAIMLSLEVARASAAGPTENLGKALKRAVAGVAVLDEMIRQMLDISRLEGGSMPLDKARVDLAALVATALERLGGPTIPVHAEGAMAAFCDADIILRVLGNLLANAGKFSQEPESVSIHLARVGDRVRVGVRDHGPGIPLEYQETIFNKFEQAPGEMAHRGFGLGLAFCKLAIQAHQGAIGLVSEPGQGSEFWFTLPEAGPAEPCRPASPPGRFR